MSATNYYNECLAVLQRIHAAYPTFSLGRHVATATSDYGDVWGMTNKEFLYALQKYEAELEINHQKVADEEYVKQIVEDATHLNIEDNGESEDLC